MSFIKSMIQESNVYTTLDNIHELVEQGESLEHLPLQPIYMALKAMPVEQVGNYLVQLTAEQRKLMLDLDLWIKDDIDVHEFEFWLATYGGSQDLEMREEFAQSEEFALYLKSRFNIWTFDIDDPQYPDHDNYFLTDDSLFLFEFDEDYPYINEVKNLVKNLYSSLGVENAYTHLFKYVSEGFFSIVEEEYQFKKGRLVDVGFVDYYDALEMSTPFAKVELVDHFINKKTILTGHVDSFSQKQLLDKRSIAVFEQGSDRLDQELSKLNDPVREQYLRFNFIRLVNGRMTLANAIRDGSVVCNRVGQYVWDALTLGLNYLEDKKYEKGVFEYFDFVELFRIGHSLFMLQKRKLMKSLKDQKIILEDGFLGQFWERFLTGLDADRPYLEINDQKVKMDDKDFYSLLMNWSECLMGLIPFITQLKKTFDGFKDEGQLQDGFYFNYNLDQIDFDALLISSYAKVLLDIPGDQLKLALTFDEYKSFCDMTIDHSQNKLIIDDNIKEKLAKFFEIYGLKEVNDIETYFINILKMSMEGIVFNELSEEDYQHVGGPIILAH